MENLFKNCLNSKRNANHVLKRMSERRRHFRIELNRRELLPKIH